MRKTIAVSIGALALALYLRRQATWHLELCLRCHQAAEYFIRRAHAAISSVRVCRHLPALRVSRPRIVVLRDRVRPVFPRMPPEIVGHVVVFVGKSFRLRAATDDCIYITVERCNGNWTALLAAMDSLSDILRTFGPVDCFFYLGGPNVTYTETTLQVAASTNTLTRSLGPFACNNMGLFSVQDLKLARQTLDVARSQMYAGHDCLFRYTGGPALSASLSVVADRDGAKICLNDIGVCFVSPCNWTPASLAAGAGIVALASCMSIAISL